jgi:hypothetical protein
MAYFTAQGSVTVPTSFITKGKQRLKQNIDTVYLKNGDEFEIELFNPTQNKVLAKIEVNGNSIGNGVILRPGERIYLERHLGESKKFLFETYTVEGDNNDVALATANNGNVAVKFYKENFYAANTITLANTGTFTTYGSPWTVYNNTLSGSNIPTFTTTSSNIGISGTANTGFVNTSLFNSSSTSVNTLSGPNKRELKSKKSIETGRIEKGGVSSQKFDYDNSTSFELSPMTTNWWKIKPVSEKLFSSSDLVTYCTECGSKRKKDTHKFCPNCGTKF